MAAPRTRKSVRIRKSYSFIIDCDERSDSLYRRLFKKAQFLSPQGRLVISIRIVSKPGSRKKTAKSRAKKTAGSRRR
jgi:hypothetical protein